MFVKGLSANENVNMLADNKAAKATIIFFIMVNPGLCRAQLLIVVFTIEMRMGEAFYQGINKKSAQTDKYCFNRINKHLRRRRFLCCCTSLKECVNMRIAPSCCGVAYDVIFLILFITCRLVDARPGDSDSCSSSSRAAISSARSSLWCFICSKASLMHKALMA